MTAFAETKLGDVLTLQRGFDITKDEQTTGSVPIVSSSGVSSYHNQAKANAPGVVIGRKGTLGTVHFLNVPYWPHDTSLWIKDFKGNDARFIYFFLQTLKLQNFDVGASNPTLNRNHVHSIKVFFPTAVDTQRKIAAVLAAYDDLIEANRRRIALLERMAEELYREWFVRLRFPGHAKTKITKGIPTGWTLVKTQDAFSFTGGGTPSKEVSRYWQDGTVNWFTPSDITAADGIFLNDSADKCTDEGFAESSAKMFPTYSVMMTSRATIGAVGINLTPACTNQGFITCVPNERYPLPFLYHWIKLGKTHFEMLSVGATFAELTKGTFKRIPVLTPPQPIMDAFAKAEAPLFQQIENLLRQNAALQRTRDLLLPRLIAGKLPVGDLDIAFPPSMVETLIDKPV